MRRFIEKITNLTRKEGVVLSKIVIVNLALLFMI